VFEKQLAHERGCQRGGILIHSLDILFFLELEVLAMLRHLSKCFNSDSQNDDKNGGFSSSQQAMQEISGMIDPAGRQMFATSVEKNS
jgi:hypothetical protein